MLEQLSKRRIKTFFLILVLLILVGATVFIWKNEEIGFFNHNQDDPQEELIGDTQTEVKIILDDLEHPWDIKLASNGDMYFSQRQLGLYKYDGYVKEIYVPDDLFNVGEGGVLGFDLSPNFDKNREIYLCFNIKRSVLDLSVVVARLTLSEDLNSVVDREDIITDIPSALSGRHSGCRVRFDRNDDNIIWVTTGDAGDGNNPQDPKSLAGKVLRVNTQGEGVEGNLQEPFEPRIFSYGHRNVQGITLFEEYSEDFGYGLTAEHGPNVDDEINSLLKGNFGWDPKLPYDESVPMTDLEKFPDAVEALWSSGDRTVATCGIEYIEEGKWQGDVLLAALKDSYILRFRILSDGKLEKVEEVVNGYGRIRQVYQAPNGRIFFTTDKGDDDLIGEIL